MPQDIQADIAEIASETNPGGNSKERIAGVLQSIYNLITAPADTRPYLTYVALLTQVGTGDPQVLELENTLGEINFARTGTGRITITSDFLFVEDKTVVILSNFKNASGGICRGKLDYNSESSLRLDTSQTQGSEDGCLTDSTIEIRVYKDQPKGNSK